ncbi:MAG: aldo/keto reductase [Chthoniobacter sp.]|uniref:aldo/keto reductase n=1 Tax=Chthoniobacter sp. TaxID=2510640 RepID=UPI0032A4DAB8
MTTATDTWLLGADLSIHRLGYGAMRLCAQPGNFGPYPDWEGGKRLLRRAVELGVDFIDTAHPYGPGWNEELIADALAPYPAGVVVTTKGGVEKTGPAQVFSDGSAASLRRFCEGSLRRLKLECIDLYQLHRPDPAVPFAESVGALAALRAEGKIRHVGLSNVTLAQVEEARGIVPIASVQNRYNLLERDDDPVLAYCAEHGIAYLPWGPLAAKPFAPEAPLAHASGAIAQIASDLGATAGQVALAWLLRRSPNIILIPGTTSIAHLEENIAAAAIRLSDGEFATLSGTSRG